MNQQGMRYWVSSCRLACSKQGCPFQGIGQRTTCHVSRAYLFFLFRIWSHEGKRLEFWRCGEGVMGPMGCHGVDFFLPEMAWSAIPWCLHSFMCGEACGFDLCHQNDGHLDVLFLCPLLLVTTWLPSVRCMTSMVSKAHRARLTQRQKRLCPQSWGPNCYRTSKAKAPVRRALGECKYLLGQSRSSHGL